MSKKFLSSSWFLIGLKSLFALLIFAYLPAEAAVTSTWTGTDNWDNYMNWSPLNPPHVPGTTASPPYDNAVFSTDINPATIVAGNVYVLDTLTLTNGSNQVNNLGSLTLAGVGIEGSGGGQINNGDLSGSGTLIFTNSATGGSTSGATRLNNNYGVINFQNNSTLGKAYLYNGNDGLSSTINFQNNSSAGDSNGQIYNYSLGVINFKDNSSAGNVTIHSEVGSSPSVINFQDNSTAGNATGHAQILDQNGSNSIINFKNNSATEGANIILAGNANNTVNFLNNSIANDAVIVLGGSSDVTLNFEDNSSPANAFIGLNSLTSIVNFNNTSPSTVYNGYISGVGALNVNLGSPSDVLTFLNPNSANFIGLTTINSGILALGNTPSDVGGDVTINQDGTLAGYGTVGINVTNNGRISPGNEPSSLGTLSILGMYVQTSSGTYVAEISPTSNDLLNITGTATLDGGELSIIDYPYGFQPGKVYTLLTAGSVVVNNKFSVDINGQKPNPFVTTEVDYNTTTTPNTVTLEMSFNALAFEAATETPNQQAVANYVLLSGGTPAVQTLSLTNDAEFQAAMDQISGATYANQTMSIAHVGSGFEHELANRFSGFPSVSEPACLCPNGQLKYQNNNHAKSGWASVYGSQDDINAGQVSGLVTTSEGIALGYEWPLNCQSKLGIGAGYTHFRGHATQRESASDHGNLLQAGIYGNYERCGWLFGAAADIGTTTDLNAERHIQGFAGVVSPESHYRANLISEQAIASYDWFQSKRCWKLRPFVGFINQQVNSEGFTENGNSGFELNVGSDSYHSARSQLGVLWEAPIIMCVRPFASVDWEHEFADRNGDFNASLVGLNAPPTFHVVGQEIGRDSAGVKAGLNLIRQGDFNLSLLYEGQFASSWQQNGAALEASFRFS